MLGATVPGLPRALDALQVDGIPLVAVVGPPGEVPALVGLIYVSLWLARLLRFAR